MEYRTAVNPAVSPTGCIITVILITFMPITVVAVVATGYFNLNVLATLIDSFSLHKLTVLSD